MGEKEINSANGEFNGRQKQPIPVIGEGSVFTNFSYTNRVDASRLGDALVLALTEDPYSPAIKETLDELGIRLETPEERFYALFYITTVSATSGIRSEADSPTATGEEKDNALQTLRRVTEEFFIVREELVDPSAPRTVLVGERFKSLSLSRQDMLRVEQEIEEGYDKTVFLALKNEKDFPLDDEHTAIPAMSGEQLKSLSDARAEVIDNLRPDIDRLDKDSLETLIMVRFGLSSWKETSNLSPERQQEILDAIQKGVREETINRVQVPKAALQILADLNLALDNPLHVHYALLYIVRMAGIRLLKELRMIAPTAIQTEIEREISNVRKGFAENEAAFETSSFKMSREEMTQVRELVEEAFRKNPQALDRVSYEDFQKNYQELNTALEQMRQDADTPSPVRPGVNQLLEKIFLLPGQKDASHPNIIQLFVEIGIALSNKKVPEMLILYERLTKDSPLPDSLDEFLEVLDNQQIPDHQLRQAGLTRADLTRFKQRFFPTSEDVPEELVQMRKTIMYAFIQLFDISRTASMDFADQIAKLPGLDDELARRGLNPSQRRHAQAGFFLYALLKNYLPTDTLTDFYLFCEIAGPPVDSSSET